jgi:hypothetical protein
MPIDDEAAKEAIFAARSSGRSILAIARQFGLSDVYALPVASVTLRRPATATPMT